MILSLVLASILVSAPLLLVTFAGALLVALASSAWFTRTLEGLCDRLGLSIGLLSLLSALGANIPNYAASLVPLPRDKPRWGSRLSSGPIFGIWRSF